jgi:hypothetical protein
MNTEPAMSSRYAALNDEQIELFLNQGYLVVPDCFSRETARRLTDRAFLRLGYEPDDPNTWKRGQVHMPRLDQWEIKEFAPRAWAAMADLLGGEERIAQPCYWGDSFIVNFKNGADRPWDPPSAHVGGWHKDGDWFVHFLDSPEQGLLTLVIWSDIRPRSGGTFVAADSVPVVARKLLEHPEGLRPGEFHFAELIAECRDFREVTGQVGDVVLLHPFILHASSQNPSGVPRFITNPAVSLKEPMCLNRPDPGDHSPVERAILRGLGVDRLEFTPSGERQRLVPERVAIQQKMLEEEKARLATLKGLRSSP